MLAYYSWVTDEQQLTPRKELAATLARLAKACPSDQTETATRLELQALAAAAEDKAARRRPDAAATDRLIARAERRETGPRELRSPCLLCGEHRGSGRTCSRRRRARASSPRMECRARPIHRRSGHRDRRPARRRSTRRSSSRSWRRRRDRCPRRSSRPCVREAGRADRETTDVYARQSAISGAAEVLAEAGLLDESDALLTRELARSHSPYYFMAGPRGQCQEARRQGGRARLGGKGLRRRQRSRDAPAVGCELRAHADRIGAGGCRAHRARGGTDHRRARARARRRSTSAIAGRWSAWARN